MHENHGQTIRAMLAIFAALPAPASARGQRPAAAQRRPSERRPGAGGMERMRRLRRGQPVRGLVGGGGRSVTDRVVADAVAAVELEVPLAGPAQEHDHPRGLAVDHAGGPGQEGVHHRLRVGSRPHVVDGVVGVDEVAPVPALDDGRLVAPAWRSGGSPPRSRRRGRPRRSCRCRSRRAASCGPPFDRRSCGSGRPVPCPSSDTGRGASRRDWCPPCEPSCDPAGRGGPGRRTRTATLRPLPRGGRGRRGRPRPARAQGSRARASAAPASAAPGSPPVATR